MTKRRICTGVMRYFGTEAKTGQTFAISSFLPIYILRTFPEN